MIKYADVALPVAVEKTFTYSIPPELYDSTFVGVRALVPFGRRYLTGLIVGLPESSSVQGLKPIKDIVDARPVVSNELLRLCIWVAEYYFAPVGEVFRAAIPHGFSVTSKRMVSRAQNRPQDDDRELSPKRQKILDLLDDRMVSTVDLQKHAGLKNINAVLNELEREGYIVTEEVLPRPKRGGTRRTFVQVGALDIGKVDATLQGLPSRKKRARQLLSALRELIARGTEEIAVSDLIRKAGTSSTIFKQFTQSGLIPTVEREITAQQEYGIEEQTLQITLNATQRSILGRFTRSIDTGSHATFLLHGVTGSGKTQVYIEAIRHCIQSGKTAIVLVPEISLTPQIVRRFKSHFRNDVAVVHSRMSAGDRQDVWRLALRGSYKIVIGPRSALFAPLANLGLIIVDEEHEASYKQFDATPRYHARDAAVVRGSLCGATVVLGSATPSVESFFNAQSGKYTLLEMPARIDRVQMPDIVVVDMKEERKRAYAAMKESLAGDQRSKLRDFQQSSISPLLQLKIEDRLGRREGVILLQNRRGFAPYIECIDCGHIEMCENCNVTMTYHRAKHHLRCHYCGTIRGVPAQCPQCLGTNLKLVGIGTQRVEEELARLFPTARVVRMDLDTTSRRGAHDRILQTFADGKADILLGTQMVAKGLDFARVTLVGVISADTQMLLPDFRSSERTFQLLTQVAGRAGRSILHGEVVIQTHQPGHYTLQHVIDHNFAAFYHEELEARRELDYPPFSRIVLVETKGENEEHVRSEALRFGGLVDSVNGTFSVLGPSPAVIGKLKKHYRWHIVVKNMKSYDPAGSSMRQALRKAAEIFMRTAKQDVRLVIDVDPVGLM